MKQIANSPLIKLVIDIFSSPSPLLPICNSWQTVIVECVMWGVMLQWTNGIVHALLAKTALSTTSKLTVHWSWSSTQLIWLIALYFCVQMTWDINDFTLQNTIACECIGNICKAILPFPLVKHSCIRIHLQILFVP